MMQAEQLGTVGVRNWQIAALILNTSKKYESKIEKNRMLGLIYHAEISKTVSPKQRSLDDLKHFHVNGTVHQLSLEGHTAMIHDLIS